MIATRTERIVAGATFARQYQLNDYTGSPLSLAAPVTLLWTLKTDIKAASYVVQKNGGSVAWTASTEYAPPNLVTNGGNVYQCTAAGESAGSGGPSGTAASISDGSVTWKYLGAAANSGITITDPTQATFVGQFTLCLAKADTASLVAGDYVYDLWASLASGLEWPLIAPSRFTILAAVGGAP
jgi:hypothetical protein